MYTLRAACEQALLRADSFGGDWEGTDDPPPTALMESLVDNLPTDLEPMYIPADGAPSEDEDDDDGDGYGDGSSDDGGSAVDARHAGAGAAVAQDPSLGAAAGGERGAMAGTGTATKHRAHSDRAAAAAAAAIVNDTGGGGGDAASDVNTTVGVADGSSIVTTVDAYAGYSREALIVLARRLHSEKEAMRERMDAAEMESALYRKRLEAATAKLRAVSSHRKKPL